ncbi:MAG: 4Fe-4S dicluster domain-containing protein [Proteobacteria bacterium]|nr:4Fe-4S dicluster domain-containing protein [Pseudomonadota bacterium]
MAAVSRATLEAAARAAGLACRGAFMPAPDDGVPCLPDGSLPATVVLLGFTGSAQWPVFAASAEARDGAAHPLDRWSRRVIGELAERFAAGAEFPDEGPPWRPFQRWARRAEPVHPSPTGVLIHPQWGLWHAYRGALTFREPVDWPRPASAPSACVSCAGHPCESTCPVGAIRPDGYDAAACAAHVASPAGLDCREGGCLARRACPEGQAHRYVGEQAQFHMRAFLAARQRSD